MLQQKGKHTPGNALVYCLQGPKSKVQISQGMEISSQTTANITKLTAKGKTTLKRDGGREGKKHSFQSQRTMTKGKGSKLYSLRSLDTREKGQKSSHDFLIDSERLQRTKKTSKEISLHSQNSLRTKKETVDKVNHQSLHSLKTRVTNKEGKIYSTRLERTRRRNNEKKSHLLHTVKTRKNTGKEGEMDSAQRCRTKQSSKEMYHLSPSSFRTRSVSKKAAPCLLGTKETSMETNLNLPSSSFYTKTTKTSKKRRLESTRSLRAQEESNESDSMANVETNLPSSTAIRTKEACQEDNPDPPHSLRSGNPDPPHSPRSGNPDPPHSLRSGNPDPPHSPRSDNPDPPHSLRTGDPDGLHSVRTKKGKKSNPALPALLKTKEKGKKTYRQSLPSPRPRETVTTETASEAAPDSCWSVRIRVTRHMSTEVNPYSVTGNESEIAGESGSVLPDKNPCQFDHSVDVAPITIGKEEKGISKDRSTQNKGYKLPNSVLEDNTSKKKDLNSLGELVWANLGSSFWWPAMIIEGKLVGKESTKENHAWVFWFGDHKVSELPSTKLRSFVEEYPVYFKKKPGKLYRKAIIECIKECGSRAGILNNLYEGETDKTMLQWASSGFRRPDNNRKCDVTLKGCLIPKWMEKYINTIKESILKGLAKNKKGNKNPPKTNRTDLKRVKQGVKMIQDVCIMCPEEGSHVVTQHPIFEGGLCQQCKHNFLDSVFTYADDGFLKYCVICCSGGALFVCDQPECGRVFCLECVSSLVGLDQLSVIEKTDPWKCFVCDTNKTQQFGLLSLKPDWANNLIRLFRPSGTLYPPVPSRENRRHLRVLSLFDGIGTAKLVLDTFGFDIDAYYISEIDEDCNKIIDKHYSESVIQLGDAFYISKKKLVELCPIDLLLGGSPTKEFEERNEERKELNSRDGLLFYQFYRIREVIREHNKGVPFFWLFENTNTMSKDTKNDLSRFLGCAPVCWDSHVVSALKQEKYYWGNLPGLHSHLKLDKGLDSIPFTSLDKHLIKGQNYKNRFDQVKKLTVEDVLKFANVEEAPCDDDQTHPVMKGGQLDTLLPIEIESLYGFPPHYTDFVELSPMIRNKLLTQAWSVPLISHLFRPLSSYFAPLKSNENEKASNSGTALEPEDMSSLQMKKEINHLNPKEQGASSEQQGKSTVDQAQEQCLPSKGARKQWYTT